MNDNEDVTHEQFVELEAERAAQPSPATEPATVEQLEDALGVVTAAAIAAGEIAEAVLIAEPTARELAEAVLDSEIRFYGGSPLPVAPVINALLDLLGEERQLTSNEMERAIKLQTTIDTLNTKLSDSEERVGRICDGVTRIGSMLRKEAEDRDWCSEYNGFVDDVNRHLPADMPQLERIRQKFAVTFTATLTDDEARELEAKIDTILSDVIGTGYSEDYAWETP